MKLFFRGVFDFFLFSSLFISLCAVLMAWQASQVLNFSWYFHFLGFVFFATLCSYNFHWYLTPLELRSPERVEWSKNHRTLHLALYFFGIAGCIFFFIPLRLHWKALAFATFITFLYSAPKLPIPFFRYLRRVAIGKTIFLAMVWTFVTTFMPYLIAGPPFTSTFFVFAASRFFLIYAICILFDYRDRDNDRLEGIRSMITFFSETAIDRLFFASIFLFFLFTLDLLRSHIPPLTVAVLLVPGIIVAALYRYAKKHFSDYLYYFVLDGLMALSPLLSLILSF